MKKQKIQCECGFTLYLEWGSLPLNQILKVSFTCPLCHNVKTKVFAGIEEKS